MTYSRLQVIMYYWQKLILYKLHGDFIAFSGDIIIFQNIYQESFKRV